MPTPKHNLEKDFENRSENIGGKSGFKGYNYQNYVGIYYMIFLHKNKKKFKIFFEKSDDIELHIENGPKYKIQSKTSKLSNNSIITKKKGKMKSILESLFDNKDFDYYKLCFPKDRYTKLYTQYEKKQIGIGDTCFVLPNNYENNSKIENFFLS